MNEFNEKRLEDAIEEYLISDKGGYKKLTGENFDSELGLDANQLFSFIQKSQRFEWNKFKNKFKENPERNFIKKMDEAIRNKGILHVLRNGFKTRGIKFKLIYFKPVSSLNDTDRINYSKNISNVIRQLHYQVNGNNSLDIVLMINGIPLVTMELKNQFTGQSVENGKNQYKYDRDPNEAIFKFKYRSLVHFTIDTKEVYMTTRLQKQDTIFLPFNQGTNGCGNVGGKGNPVNPNGFDTAYLWEEVLQKDNLLNIIHKYMHVEEVEKIDKKGNITKKDIVIFPRYHQLDVVNKIVKDVKEKGSGVNYLIQHSAGSGKSNSIAWLAYRLAGLHDENDEAIFNSIIVVTDRRILDSQLQNTIYQFDHMEGVVEKIDGNKTSQHLKDAINNNKKIIISTIQKFPVVYKEINGSNKRFAVIVDEAHSSQTGEDARKLKEALADKEALLEEYARIEGIDEAKRDLKNDKVVQELISHGKHKNLSFFAFTATPKEKTLQLFGHVQKDGTYRPFHIYSMRQAIEEGFILDVLKNYMTYNTYYKIAKKIDEDPKLDASRATAAVAKFQTLHPYNISQKVKIIVEHFDTVTRFKIKGKAKAMIVTSSRLHAIRYYQALLKYIKENNYKHLDVLVAFSGSLNDDGIEYTEVNLNKMNKYGYNIKESQLPKYFESEDFNMLVVAEKYQTGFDQPLLHTMYVDKKLSGVKAVQTLSRLNRTYKGKEDTFVLDFVNDAEDIQKSFQPYYEATILEKETDPDIIYKLKNKLDDYKMYLSLEIKEFAKVYFSKSEVSKDMGKLTNSLNPAIQRYIERESSEQNQFKADLQSFNRLYAFIIQVDRMFDKEMHEYYTFTKMLQKLLPKGPKEVIALDDKLVLEFFKIEKSFEGDIELEKTEGMVSAIKGGSGGKEKKKDSLSAIIEKMNERFGTNWTEGDKVLLQIESRLLNSKELLGLGSNPDKKTFDDIYRREADSVIAEQYLENKEIFKYLMKNPEAKEFVISKMKDKIYLSITSNTSER